MLRIEPVLLAEYVRTGKVKFQFWHILDFPNSVQASAAAECAGQQGAFWRMHDLLFQNQDRLWRGEETVLTELAASLGLDTAAFGACLAGGEMHERARAVDRLVKAQGVRVRPTFEVNGQRLQGSPPLAQWRQILDSLP
ncbi:MAG: DsbA family protein [Caldilineales bacterium]|nr:DsbA family protein [Caldilineales bacterium]